MNAAQIHLALNHAPLFLSLLGGILMITGLYRKNGLLINISLLLLITAAVFTVPVFLTGEGTEELVEQLPGVNENAIEEHEGMAKLSLVLIAVTGMVALLALLMRKKNKFASALLVISLILSLVTFGMMAQTAHLGGQIRHTELQNGVSATGNEKENNDDD